MKKYLIDEIYSDGYERVAIIDVFGQKRKLKVHFLECEEYLENGESTQKKKKGDILEGNLSIDLVSFSKSVVREFSYCQEIRNSSHIEAIVEVVQIIDEYTIYARSSIIDEIILVEFENIVDYKIGEKIFVIGSLEVNL